MSRRKTIYLLHIFAVVYFQWWEIKAHVSEVKGLSSNTDLNTFVSLVQKWIGSKISQDTFYTDTDVFVLFTNF